MQKRKPYSQLEKEHNKTRRKSLCTSITENVWEAPEAIKDVGLSVLGALFWTDKDWISSTEGAMECYSTE